METSRRGLGASKDNQIFSDFSQFLESWIEPGKQACQQEVDGFPAAIVKNFARSYRRNAGGVQRIML